MQLLATALKNLVVLPHFRTAYITLSQKELEKNHFKKGDSEGVVNHALSVNNVILACLFVESTEEKMVKISFRSKGSFSVNEFARNHFSGGGHTNAAGGKSFDTLTDTVKKFITTLDLYKTQLNG